MPRRLSAELRERDTVKPLELFFDLVFVLGFTQCTALMVGQPDWAGIGKGMLALALLWWAWSGYAWLTSVVEPEEGDVRILLLVIMAGLLVVALCVPEAFGDRALAFALAYSVVALGHIALFVMASRDNPDLRRSVLGYGIGVVLAMALLIGAAFAPESVRPVMGLIALLVYAGEPALFGIDGWLIVPAHFAERHNLIVILALGESIIVLGAGSEATFSGAVVFAAVLGMALAAALWWIYFDVVALVTQRRLLDAPEGRAQNALARDAYSYLHYILVAGIVLVAFGLEGAVVHVHDTPDAVHAFALYGGTAVYLLGHVALRLRTARTLNWERLGLALVLLALVPVVTFVDVLPAIVIVDVLLWVMIAYETLHVYDERRYQLRHGLEGAETYINPPSSSGRTRSRRPPSAD
jgi:low temperature requirement protein LtrA